MSRQTILLIFGGASSEHDVSIMSARNVFGAMNSEKYDTKLCYIDRGGKWWLLEGWQDSLETPEGVELALAPGQKSLLTLPDAAPLKIDVFLPILHGENGHEDGMIQAIGQALSIPTIGSGIGASAVCWDKLYTKQLLAASDILVTPFMVVRLNGNLPEYTEVALHLGEVLFVKPTIAGSSIGVSKVHNESEFLPALEAAFEHSPVVLIEKAIVGRELEVAVLGNPPSHQVSGVGEIIPGEEFYSYEDKYSPTSKAKVLTNSDVSSDIKQQIRDIAHAAYEIIGCKGLARVDFLLSQEGDVYLNEFNTLPGFTNISQYPKLWQEQGIGYGELIDRLIMLADE